MNSPFQQLQPFLPLIFLLATFAGLKLALDVLFKRGKGSEAAPASGKASPSDYQSRQFLCSPAELEFMRVLEVVVQQQFLIFAKVRLLDIVEPAKGLSSRHAHGARNRVIQKHVDFVLCNPADTRIRAVIELDDSSHGAGRSKESDGLKNEILAATGIPIVRFRAASRYHPREVHARISQALSSNAPAVAPRRRPRWDFSGRAS